MNSAFNSNDVDADSNQNFFVLREFVLGNTKNDWDGDWTDAVLFVPYQSFLILNHYT